MSEPETAADQPKKSAAKKTPKNKTKDAFRTISEVSDELDVPQHVLRFWETKFTLVKPLKRAGGRRYYRPQDLELLREIQRLLHDEGYTIKGVQKVLKSARGVASGIEKAREVGVQ
ncbi:MAG: MerR family transcriptional regulator, partial [Pseudomonadota bacterium]